MATAVDNRFQLVERDTAVALAFEYQGVDLTGYSVFLHIGYPDCALAIPAVLTDPTAGKFRFEFGPGDLRHGSYAAEIRFIDTMGRESTISEITLDILRRIRG